MTAAEARDSRAFVLSVAKATGTRRRAVERVLDGLEVWPSTYGDVTNELRSRGVEPPPMAERAPRSKPCPECERTRTERDVARAAEATAALEWQRRYAKLRAFSARIVEQCRYTDEEVDRFQREADTYRARVAELEAQLAASTCSCPASPLAESDPACPVHGTPQPLPSIAQPQPRQPDAVTRALADAVKPRKCTVRVEMQDGSPVPE